MRTRLFTGAHQNESDRQVVKIQRVRQADGQDPKGQRGRRSRSKGSGRQTVTVEDV